MKNTKENEDSINFNTLVEQPIKKSIAFLIDKAFAKIEDVRNKKMLQKAFEEYALYCYKKNVYMNSLALGNNKRSILEIYQPLTIKNKINKIKINSANIDFIKKYKNILLVDEAGMGKSTIVKYLSIKTLLDGMIIPIIIELRNLEGIEIIEYIKKQIEPLHYTIKASDLSLIIKQGNFLIFFDGYDEIEEKYKKSVTNKIKEFVNKTDNNYYVLTSREESGLVTFDSFQRFGICKLECDEACDLIRKIDENGELSEYIIDLIKNDPNSGAINDLLGNPLLVSILYKTFTSGNWNIPYKKSEFYNQIYYALYDKHDRTKDPTFEHIKKSGLDCSDFFSVLRGIGFQCLQESKIEYRRNQIWKLIGNVLSDMKWLSTNTDDFLYDLIYTVPYFQDFNLYLKWTHKSFMEYFAACFISDVLNEKDKGKVYNLLSNKPDKYYNVLDFCYDIDIQSFRRYIIFPLLSKYLNGYMELFENVDVRIEDYNLRRSIMLQIDMLMYISDKQTFDFDYSPNIDDRSDYLFCRLPIGNNYLILQYRLKIEGIIFKFLQYKKVDIFKIKKDYVTNLIKLQQDNISSIKLGEPISINDILSDHLYNNHSLFLYINYMAQKLDKVYVLDYEKCKKMYIEIREEIKRSKNNRKFKL